METPTVYESLSLAQIREPAHQLRTTMDQGALGELADSMSAEGLHQPVGVRGPDPSGEYEIVWGHRRLLAARLLQWPKIAARVFPNDFDPLLAAVSENLQRSDLNPMEEAHALQRFIDRGASLAALSRLFRRTPSWCSQRLALLGLPQDLQAAVAEKRLPLAVVAILSEIDHEPYRRDLTREAERNGATAAMAEVWRAHYLSDRERIVRNDLTVQEIVDARATFVITVPCDWCEELTAFEHTRGLRLCQDCHHQLIVAKHSATASAG